MASFCQDADLLPLPEDAADRVVEQIGQIRGNSGGFKAHQIRQEMQRAMTDNVGVFRTSKTLSNARNVLENLVEKYERVEIDDKGDRFNTDLLEAWELGCLLDLARVTTLSALNRNESRGAHARDDFTERDDDSWLKHTLCFLDGDSLRLDYKPVTLGRYEPKPRVY
jgi:succinate dehydrogenase / fumarate reductase flavoprotein subunit